MQTVDLRNTDAIDLSGVDTIFHLAGIANDPAVELNPYASWEVNVLATMRLADKAARAGVTQFIFPSSGAVYGVRSEPDVTEDLELMPISDYNKTKMVAERVLLQLRGPDGGHDLSSGHRLRALAAHAPRPHRQPADDAGAVEGRRSPCSAARRCGRTSTSTISWTCISSRWNVGSAGVYNAAFENLTIHQIAELVTTQVSATIAVKPDSADPRSYRLCSNRLLGTGFAPKKNVATAIGELAAAYRAGTLVDGPTGTPSTG